MDQTARRQLSATDFARVAVFAAIIAALGLLGTVNIGPVPITAQTLGVMLAGIVLGPWLGALSVTVLLALVAIGVPLLSGGRGGFGVFVGPTAGYLIGWIVGALVIGLIVHAGGRKPTALRIAIGALVGGLLVVHAFGIPVLSFVQRIPLEQAFAIDLAFVPGDLIKIVIATVVSLTLLRAYPRAFGRTWAPASKDRVTA
jgi:biotin transport system substrate-specific component